MGQKRLDKAVAQFHQQHPTTEVIVEWKPYILDPNVKQEGELLEVYAQRRFGSGGMEKLGRIRQQGGKDGANFANWKWRANTNRALQLVQYARDKANVDTSIAKAALFDALYEQGENLSDLNVLIKIGMKQLHLTDEADLRTYLEQDQGLAKVQQEMNDGVRTYRISGVPFFVIQRVKDESSQQTTKRPYGISGAQDPATFLEIFEELVEDDA